MRELDKIDEKRLQKVVQVAKLYPEFERTIDLIQQRSRYLAFLLKVLEKKTFLLFIKNYPLKSKLCRKEQGLLNLLLSTI